MEKVQLLDVCDVYQPQTIATKQFVSDGAYTVYGANGPIGHYTKYNHKESEVLMACRGATCGAINVSEPNSWINGNAMVIHPKGVFPLSRKYLMYYLKYANKDSIITGTAQPQITRHNLRDFKIVVCDKEEQERIVARIEELFSELDNGMETLRKTKQQLAVYRQAVISTAFPKMNEDNTARLDEIADITGGITKGRDLSKQEIVYLPYLRVANVQNGYLDLAQMKTIEIKTNEVEKYLLRVGDVLYTEGGDRDKLGRGTVWKGEISNCVHQNHVFRARLDQTRARPQYVAYWSMSAFARNYFYAKGKQSVNLASINKTVLSALSIPLPSITEQDKVIQEIESRLSVCESIEKAVDTALQQAEAMRQSILKQAFEEKI